MHQILSCYGKYTHSWGNTEEVATAGIFQCYTTWLADHYKAVENYVNLLVSLLEKENVRTSNKAVSLSCLAEIAHYYPHLIKNKLEKGLIIASSTKIDGICEDEEFISKLLSHEDPLIRGSSAILIGI
jgi:hypothetical protein